MTNDEKDLSASLLPVDQSAAVNTAPLPSRHPYCTECGGGGVVTRTYDEYGYADPKEEPCPLCAKLHLLDRALEAIRDIDRHATPIGHVEAEDRPAYYAVTVGALHRALALVGGQAKCSVIPCDGWQKVSRAAVAEFERIMQEEVIPSVVKVMREREEAWNRIKDTPLYASGNQASKEHAADTRRSEAP